MPTYIFNFDIHNAPSNMYNEITSKLNDCGCNVLEHPLESTYLIQAGEENVEDLCSKLEKAFSDFDMIFVVSHCNEGEYCEGTTKIRRIVREAVEIALRELKEEWGLKEAW